MMRKRFHGPEDGGAGMSKAMQVHVAVWLVIAAFVGFLISAVYNSRRAAEQKVQDQAVSYARLVEQHAAAAFDRANLALLGVVDRLTAADMLSADRLPEARKKDLKAILAAHQERTAGVISIFVSDAKGAVYANSVDMPAPLNLADRQYFQALRFEPRGTPVVSEVIFGRGVNQWVVNIARRVDLPDGQLGAVVAASLDLAENFTSFYATLPLGENSTISLHDALGPLLVRYPFDDSKVEDAAGGGFLTRHFSSGEIDGTVVATSSRDRVSRLYAFHKLRGLPVYAVVSLSLDDAFFAWRSEREFALIIALLAFFAGVFITVMLRGKQRAEDELARKSHRYQMLLRTASDGIHVLDGVGNLQEASDAFCTMLGYAREEMLGMNVAQWDAQWSAEEAKQLVARLLQSTAVSSVFETQHRTRDGRLIDVEISSIGVEVDGRPALFCSARDISLRLEAEQALVDSEQRLDLASAAGEVGVWDLDLATDEAWRSPRHDQIFGYSSLQPAWSYQIFIKHVLAEDRAEVQRKFDVAQEGGQLEMECRIERADDRRLRWISVKGEVFRDGLGKPVRMAGVVMDVTERKQMEFEIRALNENLEHRVAERTAELKKSHQELQALTAVQESIQEEERKRIARELHDELAQKLTVLKLQLQALAAAVHASAPALTQQLADMNLLLNDTARAVKLIATHLRPVVLDELGLVPALRGLVDEFAERTRVDCEFSVHPEDLSVDSRLATALYRMVQESLTNVARHAAATEVVVSLYGDPSGKIILDINDNGKGMTGDSQAKRRSFGLIGMRERAAMLGGQMNITSAPGAGTAIEIVIPRSAEASAPARQEAPAEI